MATYFELVGGKRLWTFWDSVSVPRFVLAPIRPINMYVDAPSPVLQIPTCISAWIPYDGDFGVFVREAASAQT